jgi:TPR repeat protein
MRSFIRSTFLAIFMLSSATVWGADLEKGLAAFAEGDYETALAECQPLADEGNVEAMFCVGRMYANGFGVPMDDALALKWYGLAAGENHAEAQYNLGVMHANGWGVAMNDVPAAGFYRLAAGNGFVPAQSALGYCYKHGAGVEKDLCGSSDRRRDLCCTAVCAAVAGDLRSQRYACRQDRVRPVVAWCFLNAVRGTALHGVRVRCCE